MRLQPVTRGRTRQGPGAARALPLRAVRRRDLHRRRRDRRSRLRWRAAVLDHGACRRRRGQRGALSHRGAGRHRALPRPPRRARRSGPRPAAARSVRARSSRPRTPARAVSPRLSPCAVPKSRTQSRRNAYEKAPSALGGAVVAALMGARPLAGEGPTTAERMRKRQGAEILATGRTLTMRTDARLDRVDVRVPAREVDAVDAVDRPVRLTAAELQRAPARSASARPPRARAR